MKKLLIIFIGFLLGCSNNQDGIKPEYISLTESVYASVLVQPEDLYNVYPAVAGILDSLYLREGDPVNKDQIIAHIVSQNPRIARENAKLNLELAESKYQGKATLLGNIEQEIELAKSQLHLDSVNYIRQKNIWEKNIGSQTEYETRKLKYEQGVKNLDILNKRYIQTQTDLKSAYNQSKNSLEQAQTNLQDFSIRSRMDGKVYDILKEEGEFISSQTILAKIGRAESFIIEMQIDEVDIAKISIGQTAIISLDAYPDQTFEAEIIKIYPFKDERTQTFKIEAVLMQPPKVLYAGLAGEASIVIETRDNVMTIPMEYLIDDNQVNTEDGMVKVKTGLRNMERVEILTGIDTTSILKKP